MATITGLTADATEDLVEAAKDRSTHTGLQTTDTISDIVERVQDIIGSTILAGTNVTVNYNDAANTFTINSTASGGGGGSTEGLLLSSYTNGGGTAAANTTAVQNWINAAVTAKKPAINDLGAIDININARINMVGDHLKLRANGLRLVQTNVGAAGARFGGEGQDIDSLRVVYGNNPTSSDVNANCFEFGNCLLSNYANLIAQNGARGLYMIQEIPANGDQASNTVFSCVFYNTRVTGYMISGIDMRTYVAGMAASTGNAWINTYVHNNWFGPNGTPSSWPVVFRGFDESVFAQFNVEWCDPVGDAVFIQESKNLLFQSVHFEGITLTGNAALFRPYYDARAVIHNFFAKDIRIANNAGQKSLFRGYSADGNPCSIDATSVRTRSTQNPGARPFGLMEVEAGCTGGDFVFRRVDLEEFNGPVVVDNTAVVPSQIEAYNHVRLRNFTAPNVPIDLIRTTAATAITNTTLVTDSVLQFPTTIGTYLIEGELYFTVPAAADLKYRFNHAAAATGKFVVQTLGVANTAATAQTGNWPAVSINADTVAGGVDSVEMGIAFRGTLVVTAAGTFAIQYAENAASGSLIVSTASRLSYRKRS